MKKIKSIVSSGVLGKVYYVQTGGGRRRGIPTRFGSTFIEKALENHPSKEKYLSTVIEIDNEKRWYANSMGYACQA